jgi:hypothetical protein
VWGINEVRNGAGESVMGEEESMGSVFFRIDYLECQFESICIRINPIVNMDIFFKYTCG